MDKIKCIQFYFEGKGIVILVIVNEIEVNGVVDMGVDVIVIFFDFVSVVGIDIRGWKMVCLFNVENGVDMIVFGGVIVMFLIGSYIISWFVYIVYQRFSFNWNGFFVFFDVVIYMRQGNF